MKDTALDVARVYARLVKAGRITMADVPPDLKTIVRILIESGGQ